MKYKPEIVSAYFRECGLPEPFYEFRFHPTRLWRFDLAFLEKKIYVEVDGGIWIQGSHNRGAQMIKNWEKRNAASVLGWRGLWCQPKDLCTQEIVELIRECLKTIADSQEQIAQAELLPSARPEEKLLERLDKCNATIFGNLRS